VLVLPPARRVADRPLPPARRVAAVLDRPLPPAHCVAAVLDCHPINSVNRTWH
jgi:hypothetical protein